MKKRIVSSILLAGFFCFSFAPRAYGLTQTYDTDNGYIVYTIEEGDGDVVTLDCDDVAATLMNQTSVPGHVGTAKIKIVNHTKEKYRFKDVVFYTENRVNRNVDGTRPDMPSELARTAYPPDDGAIDGVCGFDGKKIPYSMTPLRAINRPMRELYGVKNSWEVTLLQVQDADKAARERGYSSYGAYLLSYYKSHCTSHSRCRTATSLSDLHPLHMAEILGSGAYGFQGQTEIRLPRKITETELLSGAYDTFRRYGWGSQMISTDNKEYAVQQDFEMMETDVEIIKAGYRYLYDNCLYFTFDNLNYALDEAVSDEISTNGLSIGAFIQKTTSTREHVNRVLSGFAVPAGQSRTLDHVAFGVQLPNSHDVRSIDFGFKITLGIGEEPDFPSPDPDVTPGVDSTPDQGLPPDPDSPSNPHSGNGEAATGGNGEAVTGGGGEAVTGGGVPKTGSLGFYVVSAIAILSFLLSVVFGKMKREIESQRDCGNGDKKGE